MVTEIAPEPHRTRCSWCGKEIEAGQELQVGADGKVRHGRRKDCATGTEAAKTAAYRRKWYGGS